MGVWIYGGCVLVLIILYFATLGYRKEYRQQIDKKQHRLWRFYGMAMFLADIPLKKFLLKNNYWIESKMKGLYVKENVEQEKNLYVISKISLSLVILTGAVIFGLMAEISEEKKKDNIIFLERNEQGKGDNIYDLDAEMAGEYESIQIVVPERKYSREEALELLESYKEELIQTALGDNKSQDSVTEPLNFISTIGEEYITVSWDVEDSEIVRYDGTLGSSLNEEGTITTVYATLTMNDISIRQEIVLNVFPSNNTKNPQQYIQNIVDDYDNTEKEIPLPLQSGEERINFHNHAKDTAIYFFPMGFLAAIMIFLLKDKDIDQKIKKRNRQMINDYPEIVSKIMLLNKAGMSMRKAWEKTIETCGDKLDHYVYREMKLTLAKMNGGVPEGTAYEQFGKRCGIHCYIRFANIIHQNLKRGSGELTKALNLEVHTALQDRKNSALKLGEEAGTKLLVPMIIMLIVGLALIVAPTFMSIKIY